jgi:ABC-type nitrate/sulfonate/bicarbonate transport system ATPase subunit
MPFIKYLSQDFDLMPYTTVAENVGKFFSNVFPEEKKNGQEIVEMTEFADVKTKYLSGATAARGFGWV